MLGILGDAVPPPPPPPPVRAPGKYNLSPNITATQVAPPPGYTPPGTTIAPATPESKTGLYIGIGLGAVILFGGAYLIFTRH